MSTARRVVLAGLMGGFVAGCSGDSTGPTAPTVVGTWSATKAEFVRVANPATKVDVVAFGATMTVALRSDNTFTIVFTIPGQGAQNLTGTWAKTATTLTLTITSETPTEVVSFALTLSSSTMTLTGGNVTFDFDNGDEPALLNLTLTKQ